MGFLSDIFGKPKKSAPRRSQRKYKIVQHPEYGFCAFYNQYFDISSTERRWIPIQANATLGIGGDAYLDELWRDRYWVETEADAGARINKHATNDGIQEVWRG